MTIRYAISQIIGDRETQEDYCAVKSDNGGIVGSNGGTWQHGMCRHGLTAVLCDGMGGHNAGEVAAQAAAMAFLNAVEYLGRTNRPVSETLKDACGEANSIVRQESLKDAGRSGMGTTIIGVQCTQKSLNWVSVGDSHLLLLRNGRLLKLNQDHSMRPVIAEMVSKNVIASEEGSNHPDRNALRAALTGNDIELFDSGINNFALRSSDIIIIASDGLDILKPALVRDILASSFRRLASRARAIVEAAKICGGDGQDNTSVILISV